MDNTDRGNLQLIGKLFIFDNMGILLKSINTNETYTKNIVEYSLFCKLIFKFILDTVNISYYDYEIILNIDENKLDIIKKILQNGLTESKSHIELRFTNFYKIFLNINTDNINIIRENIKLYNSLIKEKNYENIDYQIINSRIKGDEKIKDITIKLIKFFNNHTKDENNIFIDIELDKFKASPINGGYFDKFKQKYLKYKQKYLELKRYLY